MRLRRLNTFATEMPQKHTLLVGAGRCKGTTIDPTPAWTRLQQCRVVQRRLSHVTLAAEPELRL